MYGRVFESMFTGSMRGSGAVVFAVWTYVIAKMREDKEVGVQVEIRPDVLAFYLGEKEEEVREAVQFLCSDDPDSTCQDEGGKRLVPVGKFVYRVVSGPHYIQIRSEEDMREYQRLAKRKQRAKKNGPPITGEAQGVAALNRGDATTADHLAAERRVSTSGASNEAGKMDKGATTKTEAPSAPPPSVPHSKPPMPQVSVPVGRPANPPTPPAARSAAAVVPAVLKQLRRVQSAPNPVFGGWQQKEIGTGTAAPAPSPAAGTPARTPASNSKGPAEHPSTQAAESSEEEPPTE